MKIRLTFTSKLLLGFLLHVHIIAHAQNVIDLSNDRYREYTYRYNIVSAISLPNYRVWGVAPSQVNGLSVNGNACTSSFQECLTENVKSELRQNFSPDRVVTLNLTWQDNAGNAHTK